VDKAEENWQLAFLVNGIAVRNLALAANEIKAILVHYSTDFVFDGKKGQPYTIYDEPNPISKYGESKLLGERFIQQHALKYYLIRVSWVFGDGPVNFARKVLEWYQGKKELKIVTDQISVPTYTVDLAKATSDLLTTDAYGIYHITNTSYCSRYQWAEYILKTTGWEGELIKSNSEEFRTPAKRPEFSVLDNFGTFEILNYKLPDWKNATKRYLREIGAI